MKMKKVISLFLSIMMLLSLAAGLDFSAYAANENGVFTYTVSEGKATITKVDTSVSGTVEVPSVIDNYPVTKIGEKAFNQCALMTKLILPDSIKYIEPDMLWNCNRLEELVTPFIGAYAGISKDDTNVRGGYHLGYMFCHGYCATNDNWLEVSCPAPVIPLGTSYSSDSVTHKFPPTFKKITVTGNVIISDAFKNCDFLTEIKLTGSPNDVNFGLNSFDFENATWNWSSDCSSAMLSVPPLGDRTTTLTISASVTSETIQNKTCTTDGVITYIATVNINGNTYTDSKTVTIPATGHKFEKTIIPQTSTEQSYFTNTCTECGYSYTKTNTPIGSLEDLLGIKDDLDGYYTLTSDIDLSNFSNFEPFDEFTGLFDGNGHTISGLQINASNSDGNTGLFTTNEGIIKNLIIDDSNIIVNSFGAELYLGTICGQNNGFITNCYNYSSISGSVNNDDSSSTKCYVGGLCGINNATVSNCANYGNVTSTGATRCFAGGISGYLNQGATVSKCFNLGTIESDSKGWSFSGGICGKSGPLSLAGLFGFSSGIVVDCYNAGTIRAKTDSDTESDSIAGGIVALMGYSSGSTPKNGSITNCYNAGLTFTENNAKESTNVLGYTVTPKKYNMAISGWATKINNSYFLENTGEPYTGAVTLTDEQMRVADSFADFDFDNVWCFNNENEYHYPQLINNEQYKNEIIVDSGSICDKHDWDVGFISEEPTCTENGVKIYTCTVCGATKTETVPATGHDYGDWEVTTEEIEATCTENGKTAIEQRACANDTTHIETRGGEVIPTLGHKYTSMVVAPTCTEQGYTTYTCSRCGDSYIGDYTDAIGHSWNDGEVTIPATYTSKGVKVYTCILCGATREEVIGVIPHNHIVEEMPASDLKSGDTFKMGSYPQSLVTDSELISSLNSLSCTMKSYGYMQKAKDATLTFTDLRMDYGDIQYNGSLYRKVSISDYRPFDTSNSSSSSTSYQDDNGYTVGEYYYFKWEPIIWKVLDSSENGVYVMSQSLLDSQAYNNFFVNTTWEDSSLREWLNNDFYNVAFSVNEQEKILTTSITNENNPENSSVTGGNPTEDKLWIPSRSDVLNADYGFSSSASVADEARRAKGTDYAKCQGLMISTYNSDEGNSYWWLRTPGSYATYAFFVKQDGNAYSESTGVSTISHGIRPAFRLDLNASICISETYVYEHLFDAGVITKEPTCLAEGEKTFTCTVCGETYTEVLPIHPENHKNIVTDSRIEPSCTETGLTEGSHCADCGTVITVQETIDALGHAYNASVTAPTCTEQGYTTYTCSRCGDSYVGDYTDALGHSWNDAVEENRVEATCTETGSYESVVYCSVCNSVFSREVKAIPALGHTYNASVTAPTCTERGYTTYTCSRCNDSYTGDYANALGHSWNDGEVTTPATYTAEGIKTFTCTACGETYTEPVPKLKGHISIDTESIENGTVTVEPTDATVGDEVTITATPDEGYHTENITVSDGEENDVPVNDDGKFVMPAGDITVDVVFAINVYTVTYKAADGTTIATEQVEHGKKALSVPATGITYNGNSTHTTTAWAEDVTAVITSDTTFNQTETTEECSFDSEVTTEATCITKGERTYTCTVCSGVKTEEIAINPENHKNVVTDSRIEPNCTETGLTEGSHCADCGDVIVAQETINALGHAYNASVTAPKCTAQGYTTYTCSRCGDSYTGEYIDALGHSWNNGEITTPATYTAEGIKTFTCTVCGETYTEAVPKLKGHVNIDTESIENGTVTVEPTDATVGDEITITATPDEGYHTESITVTDGEGNKVPVNDDGTFVMPAGDITVNVVFAINVYTVTYLDTEGEIISTEKVEHGKNVKAAPFAGISNNYNSTHTITNWNEDINIAITADTVFSQSSVTETCTFTSEITASATYTAEGVKTFTCTVCGETYTEPVPKLKGHINIDTESIENGTVTVEPTDATEGDTVTITATPDEGYHTESITVTDSDGNNVPVNDDGTFVMPAGDITADVVFAINVYTVTYKAADGTTIATEQVEHGKSAVSVPATGVTYNGNSTHTTTAWAEDVTAAITKDTTFNQTAVVENCNLTIESQTETSVKELGTAKYTCSVCSNSYVDRDRYTDIEKHWNFENKAVSISSRYYTNLYGGQIGQRIYYYDNEHGSEGTCFGFPYSSGMVQLGNYSSGTLFGENTLYQVSKTQGIINRSNNYFKNANNAFDTVIYSHLYQFSYDVSKQISDNYYHVDELISKSIASQNGGAPISILMKSSYGAHAVLVERVDKLSDNSYRIKVYDANYPDKNNFLYITKNANKFSWRMYFCDYYGRELYFTGDASTISYIEIDDKLLEILESGKTVSAIENNGGDNYGNDKYIIGSHSGSVFGCSVDMVEIPQGFNALTDYDGEESENNSSSLYWVDMAGKDANALTVTSQSELKDFELTGNSTSVSVNSESGASVNFETEKSDISSVKVESGQSTDVTYTQSVDNQRISYSVSGNSVEMANEDNSLVVNGNTDGAVLNVSVETTNDGEETEVKTAQAVITNDPLKIDISESGTVSLAYDTDNSGEFSKTEEVKLVDSVHVHSWDAGKERKAATCSTKGERVYTCAVCNASRIEYTDKTAHDYTQKVTAPSCSEDGYTTYICKVCGEKHIADKKPAVGHSFANTTVKATLTADGKIVSACTKCGKVSSTTVLYKASNIKANSSQFVYSGGIKKPVITVEDSHGNVLAAKNYAIRWDNSSSKNVGTYSVAVTLKGAYSGNKVFTYSIVPKGTELSKLKSPRAKQLKVVWKAQKKQITGYQIQYSANKSFSKAKMITVKKGTKATVKKLKSKKKYYVRIRTYKTVNKTRYYSSWSKVKSVKVK